MSSIAIAQARVQLLIEQHRAISGMNATQAPDVLSQFRNATAKLAHALDDLVSAHLDAGHQFPFPDQISMRLVQGASERLGAISWATAMLDLMQTGSRDPNTRLIHELFDLG